MSQSSNKKVAVFVGTRPEGIKMAPVIRALNDHPRLDPVVVVTGQHREMLDQVVELFGLPVHHSLQVMRDRQTLAGLTARLVEACDAVFEEEQPDLTLVQGDTTTVLAASLGSFYRRVPVGHVEAGLRTGNLDAPFPEEANRVLVSRLAALHFAPTTTARDNLLREGVSADSVLVTGNTVIDALLLEVERQRQSSVDQGLRRELAALGVDLSRSEPIVLITGHRRENFGSGFMEICAAIRDLSERHPDHRFIYPVHLNPNVREPVRRELAELPNVTLIAPLPYSQFVCMLRYSKLLLTDSGGVQEEAPGLGKPVLVMRETTERPEGIDAGTVKLVGAHRATIVETTHQLLSDEASYQSMSQAQNPYGDGMASGRIIDRVEAYLASRSNKRS